MTLSPFLHWTIPFGFGDPTLTWFLISPSISISNSSYSTCVYQGSISIQLDLKWKVTHRSSSQGTEERQELFRSHLGYTEFELGEAAVMFFRKGYQSDSDNSISTPEGTTGLTALSVWSCYSTGFSYDLYTHVTLSGIAMAHLPS